VAAQITHILAGEEALRRADPEGAAALLASAGPWFRLGCQGPDIFYHNQRTKPSGLHYGVLAHRRGYGRIVEGAMTVLPARADPGAAQARAYLLGLASHAAIDRATHPFIICFAGWPRPGEPESEAFRGCHPFLERVLDAGLLATWRGLEPAAFDLAAALPRPPSPEGADEAGPAWAAVRALWAAGLGAAYPRAAQADFLLERRVENALADALYFYEATNPALTAMNREREDRFAYLDERAGFRTVALVYPEAYPSGLDPMNLARESWPHPSGDGRESRASYLELAEAGAEEAASALRALLAALRGEASPASAAAAIGAASLGLADPQGLPQPPRASRPLPLRALMEAEYAKRLAWARRELGRGPAN